MKSIKEFENFKVDNLKYFIGGGSTGAGELCSGGQCLAYDSDYISTNGSISSYENVRVVIKPCE